MQECYFCMTRSFFDMDHEANVIENYRRRIFCNARKIFFVLNCDFSAASATKLNRKARAFSSQFGCILSNENILVMLYTKIELSCISQKNALNLCIKCDSISMLYNLYLPTGHVTFAIYKYI